MKSYIIKHWRGELSLAWSYWVNNAGISFVFSFFQFVVNPYRGISSLFNISTLDSVQTSVVSLYIQTLIWPWQAIGLWRSAQSHIKTKGRFFWPRSAQAMVALGVAGLAWSIPLCYELTRVALLDDDYQYTITVLEGQREVQVNGGIGPGLTDAVKEKLKQAPRVATIQLNLSGGFEPEADKLRDYIRKRNLNTYTATGCTSVCINAFMAGPKRILNTKARLGFRRVGWLGIRDWFGAPTNQETKNYLISRGVTPKFAEKATSLPSDDLWIPSVNELLGAGVITNVVDSSKRIAVR